MAGVEILLSALCLQNATCVSATTMPEIKPNNEMYDSMANVDSSAFSDAREQKLAKLREEINGQRLTLVSYDDYPLSYMETVNGTRLPKGVAFQLLSLLTVKLNFTYDLIFPDNNIYGSTNDMKGSLIEVLNTSKADMAVAFIPVLPDARKYIEYSTATLDEGEWIMIMLRPAESATGAGLLAPFNRDVWLLILFSMLTVGPIIYGLIILRNKLTKDDSQDIYPMSHCMWFVYGGLMKQGSTLSPIGDSTRLLFATWWIFITILTSFYTANLTAFLTLSRFTLPINNVDDIIKKDKNFVSQRGGLVEYAIKNTNESLTQLTSMVQRNRGIFTEDTNSSENLINWVEKKDYVYIRDRPAIDYLIYADYVYRREQSRTNEKLHCPFAISFEPFDKRKRAFAFPMNSKWSMLFNAELLHLVESGIITFMLTEKLPDAEICPQNLASTERQLRNGDLLMTYEVMITGFCIGAVIFISELIFKCINDRNMNKIRKHSSKDDHDNDLLWTKDHQNSKLYNITPPPPYAELFNRSRNHRTGVGGMGGGGGGDNGMLWSTGEKNAMGGVEKTINGRNYMVMKMEDGSSRLIPLRTPSAALFEYNYANTYSNQ